VPLVLDWTKEFGRDLKRAEKVGRDLEKYRAIVESLRNRAPLTPGQKDHALKGNGKGTGNAISKVIGSSFIGSKPVR
jgi:addiction module RelE/StbE family toxin